MTTFWTEEELEQDRSRMSDFYKPSLNKSPVIRVNISDDPKNPRRVIEIDTEEMRVGEVISFQREDPAVEIDGRFLSMIVKRPHPVQKEPPPHGG